ncbi:hypothetical protein FYK55_14670 [Roseiconus nitratireducens]|uniref:Cytochrome c domain-containing protein n=1 Tax=Roseiconus nitratireducens TaxID=2605748 RepID=A0A5M6D8E3_9BACT|nr:hypothetical protein [Roseiconus nitratireducens]KAA5542760.1 hypothetical protein FYK55_14670 [Roseiconus nitratireducens]
MSVLHLPKRLPKSAWITFSIAWIWVAGISAVCAQTNLHDPPIRYRETPGENPVSELFAKLDRGEVVLNYEPGFGSLRSILRSLDIPLSSQALVYSKTSLQSGRISPANPRAIYFNDDVYVGWVRGSSLLEISTADPHLGAAFYTVQMSPRGARTRRENDRCLACHQLPTDMDRIPGHTVRSVMTRDSGKINLLLDHFVTGHTSPISQRWGGWYVTGDLGSAKHLGNAFLEGDRLIPTGSPNPSTLSERLEISAWPTPHSDVVALMVMEHQTQMHNQLTRANFAVRRARHGDFSSGEGEPLAEDSPETSSRETLDQVLDEASKWVVDYLLFVDEAPLEEPVQGSNAFAAEFAARGPTDSEGRSLRDFDLTRRMFRYPCSYLIYSDAFDSLDQDLQQRVYQRLLDVLTERDASPEYAHLSSQDRAAILSILRQTKQNLPDDWGDHEEAPRDVTLP